jgi:hypothetical protein
MTQFIVIDLNDPSFNYIVEDLLSLINEMYEVELMNGNSFDTVNQWFNDNHKVFKIEGTIEEIK